MPLLPPGMPAPPSFRKHNPADQPILMLNLTSDTLPMSALDDYAENDDRAAHLDGRAASRRCRCRARRSTPSACRSIPTSCTRSSIGINEIDQALQNWNVNLPTGQLFGPTATYNIKAAGQLMNADAFRPIVVAYRNGAPVRLDQVANVIDSVENDMQRARGSTRRTAGRAARDQPAGDAAAGQQHHRGHRRGPRAAAVVRAQLPPSVHLTSAAGSLAEHPRGVQATSSVTMLDHAGPGGRRDLPVPAQRLGDADPGAGAAVLDPRHVRGDAGAATSASTTCR